MTLAGLFRHPHGRSSYGGITLRVNQIKTVEQGTNNNAMVVLFEKMNGYDYFWTQEPYTVVRQRVLEARNEAQDSRP